MSTTGNTSHCLRCGRTLRSESSIAAKYGRWCRAKIRAAALAEAIRGFTAAQVEKAKELIADGGIVAFRPDVFRAVSSKGDQSYLVHAKGHCACPAGLRSVRCYHLAAARMIAAA